MVVHVDNDHSKCTHCSKVMKKCTMTYHLGICNPASPFSKCAATHAAHQTQIWEDEDQDQKEEEKEEADLDFAEFEMFIRSTVSNAPVTANVNQHQTNQTNQTSIDTAAALMAIVTRQIDLQSIVLRAI